MVETYCCSYDGSIERDDELCLVSVWKIETNATGMVDEKRKDGLCTNKEKVKEIGARPEYKQNL